MKCGTVYSVVVEDYIKKTVKFALSLSGMGGSSRGRRFEGAESIFSVGASGCNSLFCVQFFGKYKVVSK